MATTRSSGTFRYALQLNQAPPVPLRDVTGLLISSKLVDRDITDFIKKRIIESLEYNEVTLGFDIPLPEPIFQLFYAVFKGTVVSGVVSILKISSARKVVRTYDLGTCNITEASFSGVDGSSKDKGFATLKLRPQHIDLIPAGKGIINLPFVEKSPVFLQSNFSIAIDKVLTVRVRSLSSLVARPHFTDASQVPGTIDFIEFKSLQLTISEAETDRADWQIWLQASVKNQQEEGKNGTLTFLGPDLKKVLFEMSLTNLIIVSVLFAESGTADDIPTVKLELMFDAATITSNGQK